MDGTTAKQQAARARKTECERNRKRRLKQQHLDLAQEVETLNIRNEELVEAVEIIRNEVLDRIGLHACFLEGTVHV
jgi:hypothetical protein